MSNVQIHSRKHHRRMGAGNDDITKILRTLIVPPLLELSKLKGRAIADPAPRFATSCYGGKKQDPISLHGS